MEINNNVSVLRELGFQFLFQHGLYVPVLSDAGGRLVSQQNGRLRDDVHFWRHMHDRVRIFR